MGRPILGLYASCEIAGGLCSHNYRTAPALIAGAVSGRDAVVWARG